MNPVLTKNPVALITGAARRIGAEIAAMLHQHGFNVVIHYSTSGHDAKLLTDALNQQRANSAIAVQAELNNTTQIKSLARQATEQWQRLDLLVNNASTFYPTPLTSSTEQQWHNLFDSNAKGPYFLCQAVAKPLQTHNGAIINIADIHTEQPLKNHAIYCMAKAANRMMTKSLAKELAPHIRVNGIAPGAIMWPENEAALSAEQKQKIITKIPLGRPGSAQDIAATVLFLAASATYVSGEVIAVDGGRRLNL